MGFGPGGKCSRSPHRIYILVRFGAQKSLNQHRKPQLLTLYSALSSPAHCTPWQPLAAFAIGQEPGVTHPFKMPCRNVADVAPNYLFLTQHLELIFSRAVINIVVNYSTGAHRGCDLCSQAAGHDQCMAVTQQVEDGTAPNFFCGFLFEEEAAPDAVHNLEAAAGGVAEQRVEQRPIIVEKCHRR